MRKQKENSLSLYFAIFTLLSVIAVGSMYLSLERSKHASISNNISKLNREVEILNRQNLDLTSRIAKLESPDNLKMHLGTLSPISESMLIVQSYEIVERDSSTENVALGYSSQTGTVNSINQ